MILSFNKQQFVDRILEGTKIHTIREDKHNRWKPGNKIHAWYKNPRNVSQQPMDLYTYASYNGYGSKQIEIPTQCVSTQKIYMCLLPDSELAIRIHDETTEVCFCFLKDGTPKTNTEMSYKLCRNDGFDTIKDFYNWFAPLCKIKTFRGKIIHWTNFKY